MASGEVVIQSMWSPAVAAVRSKGVPASTSRSRKAIAPGAAASALAKHLTGSQLDAAYEYINW